MGGATCSRHTEKKTKWKTPVSSQGWRCPSAGVCWWKTEASGAFVLSYQPFVSIQEDEKETSHQPYHGPSPHLSASQESNLLVPHSHPPSQFPDPVSFAFFPLTSYFESWAKEIEVIELIVLINCPFYLLLNNSVGKESLIVKLISRHQYLYLILKTHQKYTINTSLLFKGAYIAYINSFINPHKDVLHRRPR